MADLMREIISSSTKLLTTRPTSFPGSKGQGRSDKNIMALKKLGIYMEYRIWNSLVPSTIPLSNDGKHGKATDKAVCRVS